MSERFQSFAEQLDKYSPRVHGLRESATLKQIARVEETLSLCFPDDYKEFLQRWNGGSLFCDDIVLLSIPGLTELEVESDLPNLVNVNSSKCSAIPHSHLIIASYSYGDEVCLDLDWDSSSVGNVYKWDHETGGFVKQWNSFESWLEHETEFCTRMYNLDGSLKKTLLEKAISRIRGLFR